MTLLSTELAAKRLQMMRELVPHSKSTSLLAFDNAFATPLLISAMKTASQQLQLDLVVQLVKTDEDLPRAFAGFEKATVKLFQANLVWLLFANCFFDPTIFL